jgi:hypothetical protein
MGKTTIKKVKAQIVKLITIHQIRALIPNIYREKSDVVVHTCNPSYSGG